MSAPEDRVTQALREIVEFGAAEPWEFSPADARRAARRRPGGGHCRSPWGDDQSESPTPAGAWSHRVMVVAVAAVILAVFFVPLPHVSLFKRLVAPAKVSTPTSTTVLAPVEIQLLLDRTQVTAGTPIRGEAMLTNTTGRTITVETCAADGWLSVGLTNHEASSIPLSPAIACAPTVRLSPGLSRFPITISSDFQSCTQTSSQATPQLPVCTSQGEPPLPAGQYLTKIVIAGLPTGTGCRRRSKSPSWRQVHPRHTERLRETSESLWIAPRRDFTVGSAGPTGQLRPSPSRVPTSRSR